MGDKRGIVSCEISYIIIVVLLHEDLFILVVRPFYVIAPLTRIVGENSRNYNIELSKKS